MRRGSTKNRWLWKETKLFPWADGYVTKLFSPSIPPPTTKRDYSMDAAKYDKFDDESTWKRKRKLMFIWEFLCVRIL